MFVGLFAALPPSVLTSKRLSTGSVTTTGQASTRLPASMPLRIVCLALQSLLLFGGGAVLVCSLLPPIALGFTGALLLKAIYGVIITLGITPLAVNTLAVHAGRNATVRR